jgi:aspartate carbamoyltransferase catalytic subunit
MPMIKDLVGIKDLSKADIELVLDTAAEFKDVLKRDVKKVPALRGKTVVNLFFEPSTRTRTSFELAEKRLSTDVLNFSVPTSSVVKGESLFDTVKTIEAYGVDFIVMRHSSSGAPHFISKSVKASVINAGDGVNEHPTQALLDALTIKEKKGGFSHLEIAIVGDVLHSRVARSNIYCLTRLGARVRLIGPPTLVPQEIAEGIAVFYDMDKGLEGVDVVMMLRVQMERQGRGFFPTTEEYFQYWGLDRRRLNLARRDAVVMHPGPMNRGIEISSEVADSSQSVILEQVTNGLAVRMAVLYLLGGSREAKREPEREKKSQVKLTFG